MELCKKIGDPMKGSKEAKFSNEFDICHSAAALLPEKLVSVEVPRLFIWLNFFWCEAMPIFSIVSLMKSDGLMMFRD